MGRGKHFITLKDWSWEEIEHCLKRAYGHKKEPNALPRFPYGKVANLFFEPSTRTALSFSIAARNLGMQVFSLDAEHSSMKKGETFEETIMTLANLGLHAVVVRHKENGFLAPYCENAPMGLINAGEGSSEHPSQALLDAMTIFEKHKRLKNLTLALVGDLSHSRVAASHISLWSRQPSNQILLLSPEGLGINDEANSDWDTILEKADVLIMLRHQKERHLGKMQFNPLDFQLNEERLKKLNKKCLIMHPGPYILGEEITSDVLTHPQCSINQQVKNSVFTRMAIIEKVMHAWNF
jgi:aspartate carbamoyltransferase catalytic subunit